MFHRPRNAAERLATRQIYIPKGETVCKIEMKDGSATVYLFSRAGKPYAMGFRGTAGKPEFHYSYRDESRRRESVQRFLDSVKGSQQRRAAVKAEKSAWVNPLKVGEILYTSWGYDQTNTEFYVVTSVSGRRVKVAQIASDGEDTGFMSHSIWPAMPIRVVGEETTHIAQPSGPSGVYVKISDSIHAWPETGRAHSTSSYA